MTDAEESPIVYGPVVLRLRECVAEQQANVHHAENALRAELARLEALKHAVIEAELVEDRERANAARRPPPPGPPAPPKPPNHNPVA